jgi:lysozyme
LLPFLGTWENGVINGKNFAHQMVTNGFILEAYKDSRGLPTVGCGHLVVAADKLKLGKKITEERAKELLKKDLAEAESAVNRNVKVPLCQYEYDALVSLTFNTGAHGASKLFAAINAGKYESIPATIEKYRTGGGNEGRRAAEATLFKSGVYDAKH